MLFAAKTFSIKNRPDGRALLNLACGVRTHEHWNNLDFSTYAKLAKKQWLGNALHRVGLLSQQRYQRLMKIDPDIIIWDLRKGIPFEQNTFDAVYASHFIEHLDKTVVPSFLNKCHTVIKDGGILRLAVPDLEKLMERYHRTQTELCSGNHSILDAHRQVIHDIFDQMVIKVPYSTLNQKPVVRWIEKRLRPNTMKTGELHRWMYDRYTLTELLTKVGFRTVSAKTATTSHIPQWTSYHLDMSENGDEHNPGSLYIEAIK